MRWCFLAVVLAGSSSQWLKTPPERTERTERIVSLAPSITEILFALGAGHRVVGVTRYDTYPEAVNALPRVGGFIDPDPEAVLALQPDLVIAIPTSGGRRRIDILAELGTPVLVVPAESIDDLWLAIRAVGKTIGRQRAAGELITRVRRDLAAIREAHRNSKRLRALMVVGRRPLVAVGRGTFLDSLLAYVNARNVIVRGGAYPRLDLEALVTLDPDVIIDLTASGDQEYWTQLTALRAVRADRVVRVPEDLLQRPGPRLADGLATLARALRPGQR